MRERWMRLLAFGHGRRREREFDDELGFHVEALARTYEARGCEPQAARRAAERELGGLNRTKQAWRDQRTWLPLEELLQDVRYAIRVLRRSIGVTALAAVMLALAVGATTALFTVVDAVLLAPLPYAHAERLAVIYEEYLTLHAPNVSVTPGTFLEWQDRGRAFEAMTAIDQRQQNLTSDGDPLQVSVGAVSRGFGPTIGVTPQTGRLFADAEFTPGHERVALIGHELWTTRYGRMPIEGRALVLDDEPYTIIGVMPAGFRFPTPQQEIWVPLPMTASDRDNRTGHGLFVVARVRERTPLAAADRELHEIAAALRREFPDSNREWGVTMTPAREAMVGETTNVLRAMTGAVALLLLVACGNVAGLLLTHGVARNRELAIRAALGASRLRIVRQLLTESVVLAAAGTAAGVVLAWLTQPLLESLRPEGLITWKPIAIDVRALAFAAGVALACGVIFGTLPAFAASRANLSTSASSRAAGHYASRVRHLLVVVEVALALVLVATSALLAEALTRLTTVEPGFRAEGVVTMTLSLPASRYRDDQRVDQFYDALFDRIRSLPGVRGVGAIQALPLSGNTSVRPYHVEGAPLVDPPSIAHYRIVTPGYFEVMRIPLRAGRTFTDRDTADRPLAVIVNEMLRRQAWGDRDPIGARLTFGGGTPPNVKWAEVVGVIGDVRHFGAGMPSPPEMYWPAAQIAVVPGDTLRRMRRGLTLVVATAAPGDPLALVAPVRAAVGTIDPDQPISHVRTLTSLLSTSMWLARAATWLLTIFGGAAMTFALLGVFGAASYAVTQRRRELAVRLALGAEPRAVARLALAGALGGAVGGIVVGAGLAVVLTRAISTLFISVRPIDATTLSVVSAGLAAAAAVAGWIPARRAGRIDPMQALRTE